MIRFLACSLFLLLGLTAPGRAQFLHTFTPDPPPIGDGIEYPRTLNPARQSPGGGISPDFFGTGVGTIFQSTNGNPAFFDANNLLTRPAERITNEAFWTDPKIGVFDSGMGFDVENASFGFQFDPRAGEDFGFDLAIASVSDAPPTSLPFFIQNTDGDFGTFQLGLALGTGDVAPTEAGTFDTLNSPFQGREARFRISHAEIEALLGGSAPLLIFSIDMFDVSTLGGTTQVALDNFVLAGASVLPNEPQREPVRFQSELIPPSTTQYFVLDPTMSSETGIEVDVDALPAGSLIELAARTSAPPGSAAPEAEVSATVTALEANGDLLTEAFDIGVSAPSETPGTVPPFATALSEVDVAIGPGGTSALHAVGARSMTYGDATFGLPLPDEDQILEAYETTHAVQASRGDLRGTVEDVSDLLPHVSAMLVQPGEGGRQARGAADDFTLYVGYTLQDYLAEKRQLGLDPVVGDSGSALTPVTDDEGQVVDFFVDTWRIADTPGTYIPTLLLPEPGACAMLAIGGLVLAAAARRRR